MSLTHYTIFERIKQSIGAQEAISRYFPGELKRRGRNLVGRCPFHEEKIPSFVVFPDGYRCFGCLAHGDAVDFVARLHDLRPIEAARMLAAEFGVPVEKPTPETRKRMQEAAREREIEKAFNRWCENAYQRLALLYRCVNRAVNRENWERMDYWLHKLPVIEYYMDILQYGGNEMRLELLKSEVLGKWL